MTVDVNVSLSHWPCRRLPLDVTEKLVRYMAMKGVTQAWAGTFEAILHNDLASANQRLADECGSADINNLLLPMGAINVTLPGWEDDLKRCHENHGMRGIRLVPGYHGYSLDDARLRQLLELVDEYHMLVQIAVRLEDPRTQHRLLSVKDVDLKPLLTLVADHSKVPIVLLNALSSGNLELHSQLVMAGRIYFDLSTLEGLAGLERQLQSLPAERILFGSHSPFFVFESAEFKLKESALPAPIIAQIDHENAASLLAGLSDPG